MNSTYCLLDEKCKKKQNTDSASILDVYVSNRDRKNIHEDDFVRITFSPAMSVTFTL